MGIHGSLWLYGAVSLVGFFFVLFTVKESYKLTDKEKKELYCPMEKESNSIKQVKPILLHADEEE